MSDSLCLPYFSSLCGHYGVLTGERSVPQRDRENSGNQGICRRIHRESEITRASIPARKTTPPKAMSSSRSMTAAALLPCTVICPGEGLQPVLNDYVYM